MNYTVLALAAAERQNANGAIILLVEMLLIGMIFYWLVIRPQRREHRRLQDMIQSLGKGDEIALSGGLIGTVLNVGDDGRLLIRSGESKVQVDRGRVSAVLSQRESAKDAKE